MVKFNEVMDIASVLSVNFLSVNCKVEVIPAGFVNSQIAQCEINIFTLVAFLDCVFHEKPFIVISVIQSDGFSFTSLRTPDGYCSRVIIQNDFPMCFCPELRAVYNPDVSSENAVSIKSDFNIIIIAHLKAQIIQSEIDEIIPVTFLDHITYSISTANVNGDHMMVLIIIITAVNGNYGACIVPFDFVNHSHTNQGSVRVISLIACDIKVVAVVIGDYVFVFYTY